jgi:hypothetical protein
MVDEQRSAVTDRHLNAISAEAQQRKLLHNPIRSGQTQQQLQHWQ